MHQLRLRSGLKAVFQNNKRRVTVVSQTNFYMYAERNLINPNPTRQPEETPNVLVTGLKKLQLTLKQEAEKGQRSEFRWGSSQGWGDEDDSSGSD